MFSTSHIFFQSTERSTDASSAHSEDSTSGAPVVEDPEQIPAEAREAFLENELAALQTKLNEAHDRMMRVAADADNTRKRLEKEKVDTRIYAISEFARDLLPVIDAFDKAMSAIEKSDINFETEEGQRMAAVVEGVKLVSKAFADATKKHGIERLPGAQAPFNPSYHNAIAKVVDASYTQETVIDEFMPGYKIGDRILRTAMVRVGAPD